MPGLSGGGGAAGQVRAGAAYIELFLKDNRVWRALDRVQARFEKFAGFAAKAGVALGGAGAAGVAAFKPALDALGEQGKIADLAELFGLSAESASRLFGIMAAGGSDLRDAQEGLATFNQRVNDALTGKGEEAADLFRELNVGAERFEKLDTAERFYRLLDAIKASNSPLGKLGLLMKAVGEDTGKNLGGVLQMTADQVRELGIAFETSAEDLAAAREATRAQALATAYLGRVWREMAVAIAPVVKEMADRVTAVADRVAEFVHFNREAIATAFKVAGALTVAGAAFVGLGAALSAAGVAWGVFKALVVAPAFGLALLTFKALAFAVSSLLTPYGLVAAAVAGLGYLFVTQTEAGAALWDKLKGGARTAAAAVGDAFRYVAGVASEAWGGIVAAVSNGDLALAGEIALTALELVWAKAVARMTEVWNGFKRGVVDTWHEVTGGLSYLFAAMWAGLRDGFFAVRDGVVEAFERVKGVVAQLGEAFAGVRGVLVQLGQFLAPVLAPLVGPFLLLAKLVSDAWDGLSSNVMETLNNFTSWVDKSYTRMADTIGNAFKRVARFVLENALKVAEAVNKVDPFGVTKKKVDELRALRDGIGPEVTAAETEAKVQKIEDERAKVEKELRKLREKEKAAREELRAKDEKAATDKAAELEKKLAELTAKAKAEKAAPADVLGLATGASDAVIAGALAAARGGAAVAARAAGSSGSFTAALAGQRFGAEQIDKRQLAELVALNRGVEAVESAVTAVAKGLALK